MQPFRVSLRGEDGLEFVVDISAGTKSDCRQEVEAMYPEADILSIHTKEELESLELDRYHYMQQIYDDPMYDDCSYYY